MHIELVRTFAKQKTSFAKNYYLCLSIRPLCIRNAVPKLRGVGLFSMSKCSDLGDAKTCEF